MGVRGIPCLCGGPVCTINEKEEDEDKCVVCGRKEELRDYHMPSTIIERVCVNLPCGDALSMDYKKLRIEEGKLN